MRVHEVDVIPWFHDPAQPRKEPDKFTHVIELDLTHRTNPRGRVPLAFHLVDVRNKVTLR